MQTQFDLVVIGAGSGGLGAAITAGRNGLKVLLVDKNNLIGGNVTCSGVSMWEPGVGGTGLPFEIYCRLKKIPNAVGIYSYGRHFCWQDGWYWPTQLDQVNFPGGESLVNPEKRYRDTLQRFGAISLSSNESFCRAHWNGVVFEPAAYEHTLREMLLEKSACEIRTGTTFTRVFVSENQVEKVQLRDQSTVTARWWIDATDDASFTTACGGRVLSGSDPKSRFDEPAAPDKASPQINGVTLIYRIRPALTPKIESLPVDTPENCWWAPHFPPMSCVQYPNGDRNCNMLPTLEGLEFLEMGYSAAYAECTRRVKAHWHFIQKNFPEFQKFRLHWIAPRLGIRESNRAVTDYILTEHDILRGLAEQSHPDIVAIADHAVDRHSRGGGCAEVKFPYGIPFRCLIPKNFRNLLITSRAAGFSSIAASSCRLSRTMMQLGQAAGIAVTVARGDTVELPEVDFLKLRTRLKADRVQLEWPLPEDLQDYLHHA